MAGVSAALPTPTHNAGAQAQGALFAAQMLEIGKKAMAMLDASSPLGQAVLDALKRIGKEVGAAPPETQVNSLQSQLMEARRNAMQRAAMMQLQARAAQGGPPGAAPGGAPAQQPLAMMAA